MTSSAATWPTQIRIAGPEEEGDKKLEAEAAEAYSRGYLTLFRPPKEIQAMRKNHAESLFASDQFVAAGREYETIAKTMAPKEPDPRGHPATRAILGYYSALRSNQLRSPAEYETVFSRAAVEQLGVFYVQELPAHARMPSR